MIVHIDDLYGSQLHGDEFDRINRSIQEFLDEADDPICGSSNELNLLWRIGTKRNGFEVDYLTLQFVIAGRDPEKVEFPILSTRGITGASLYARYIRATATVESNA